MTATFHLRFPSAKTSSYTVPPVRAAGSAFGIQCMFLLLAVVTRWAGQLKAQAYHQVAMHRDWVACGNGASQCQACKVKQGAQRYLHCNLVKPLSFMQFILLMQNYSYTCASHSESSARGGTYTTRTMFVLVVPVLQLQAYNCFQCQSYEVFITPKLCSI